MRTKIVLVLALLTVLTATSCGENASGKGGKKSVVAAFYPIAFAAAEIGGSRVDVANLTPPGVEPHDLEAKPSDVQKVESADLVLLMGHGFQPQLESAAHNNHNVVLLLDTSGLRRQDDDPHVWLDPNRFALIAERIGAALHRPRRTATFVAELHRLDGEYRAGLAHCARNEIVTSHEAFAYLAQRYGFQQIGITGVSPEAEPTPQALQHVIDVVRRAHATTVFFETLLSPRIADTVARETHTKTAVLDPIEGLTPSEADRGENYFTLMRQNLRTLRTALGCS
jgi:zinc transport system substrate-binding protein